MTTPATKRKRTSSKKSSTTRKTYPIKGDDGPSFFAHALTIQGRFTLAWMLLCAAVRILVKGRALV